MRIVIRIALLAFAASAARLCFLSAPGVMDIAHLNAIALPFSRLTAWFFGAPEPDLVPAPQAASLLPLLVDWLLWRAVPFGLTGLRLAHLLVATAALAVLFKAVAMRMDLRCAALAAMVVALSPRFVDTLVDLGPAPYVFALFCWQLAILLTRGKIGGPQPLWLFALLAAGSVLCGPAGMLSAATGFGMLLFAAPDRSEFLRRLPYAVGVGAISLLPLYRQISSGELADPFSLQGIFSFGTKLVVHNADLLLLPGGIALAIGTVLLLLLGLVSYFGRLLRNGPSERTHPFALLMFGSITGLALVLSAGPALRIYAWSEANGQSWLSLLLVLLATACFTPRLVPGEALQRRVRIVGAVLLIAGATIGAVALQLRAEWFAAGPEAGLARELAATSSNRAIIYTGADWGRIYYPHAWLAPEDNEQWLLTLDGTAVRRIAPGGRLQEPQPLAALNGYANLLLVRVDRRGWHDLHAVSNAGLVGAMPPAALASPPVSWRPDPAEAAPGEYWLTTQLVRTSPTF